MITVVSTANKQEHITIHRSKRSIRESVKRIRHSERRACERSEVQTIAYITPVIVDGNQVDILNRRCPIIGFTRDISLRGVGFTHDEPLQARHVVVTFDLRGEGALSLLAEIKWSRIRAGSCYLTGCKLIGVVKNVDFLE